jgi:hypothetical protein
MTITRHDCPEGAEEFEGTQGEIAPLYKFQVTEQESADGVKYFGSVEETFGTTVYKQFWNLTGTESP